MTYKKGGRLEEKKNGNLYKFIFIFKVMLHGRIPGALLIYNYEAAIPLIRSLCL